LGNEFCEGRAIFMITYYRVHV